ncbi:TetR/AcrR family transcriptional regulator [Aeromicrobium endophyticum]|uniref:TetR/AcrR family transcriptional regulator n=1 Tax=Aeromicrobium endophyticum TaxID=2292704 RepID=A0A371PCE9_9ACTN|nr:TetR/AcrR family transcriptional regulator [Aeromicrobium endophyticum]REK73605.1 TetR/AcrR family transcriptional regulator [Aeromicrobium endophyticum]
MPIEVNVDDRLREIAAATLDVARESGVNAVSYRSVARAMGGSTAIVTNYLPTRAALLKNALDHTMALWHVEMARVVAEARPGDRLRTLATWSCTTEPDDLVIRHMLIHALAELGHPVAILSDLQRDADEHRQALLQAATDDGVPDPAALADAIYLICHGFYLSTVEARDAWPDSRASAAIDAVLASGGLRSRS